MRKAEDYAVKAPLSSGSFGNTTEDGKRSENSPFAKYCNLQNVWYTLIEVAE